MIQFDVHIFQMGWFNHQLVLINGQPRLGGDEWPRLIGRGVCVFFFLYEGKIPSILVKL